MTPMQAAVLGVVQGATEYLPVSSSAHLVLVPAILGWPVDGPGHFEFDVLVQLGTLIGVFIYFWRDLWLVARDMLVGLRDKKPFATAHARMGYLVILATLPATVIGLLFKDTVEAFFGSPRVALIFLLVTACLLAMGERWGRRQRRVEDMGWVDGLVVGFAQALALFPGVSRSGSTISVAMLFGVDRPDAAKFSFLMSIPVMLGASLLAAGDLLENRALLESMLLPLAVGFVTAAITGYLVIRWFLAFLKDRSLYLFAAYCGVVGLVGLFLVGG
jgi:undecaprenyl-diphosphatase